MHESCSINDIKSDYIIALYSVTSVFGHVEFTVSNKIIPAFELKSLGYCFIESQYTKNS